MSTEQQTRDSSSTSAPYYSTNEIQALRVEISANPDLVHLKDAVELVLYTGSRLGELGELRWCDFDLATQGIYLGYKDRAGCRCTATSKS
jgi:integrase